MSLLRRVEAYRHCFLMAQDAPKTWRDRLEAWLRPSGKPTPHGEQVLADLARFCRATKPTSVYLEGGAVDPIASARMDGRREVWLWINEYLHLDHKTLLYLMERDRERYTDDD